MNDLRAAKRGAALLGSILLLALLLNLGTPLPSVRAVEGNPPVVVAGYDGAVVPITAKYLERVIRHAENLGATA